MARFFELSFLRYAGKVSYSLYLWHMLFIGPISALTFIENTTVKTVLFFMVSFAAAELSFRFIEMPFLRSKYIAQKFKNLTRRFTRIDPALRSGSR